MNSRFIGGILLIVGTSIGGGMLALPAANAAAGFWGSSLWLLGCWALMTLGAFYILEVSLRLPFGTHMVSMANHTLGLPGLLATWICYLLLLYALLSAYISGGADVLGGLIGLLGLHWPSFVLAPVFTLMFGLLVYQGIRQVDLLNRALMFMKLAIYMILVVLILGKIQWPYLQHGHGQMMAGSLMILITSFGFAIIVPNLRDYFQSDVQTLKRVVFIGSLVPLICYIAWDAVIIGSLPAESENGLIGLMHDAHATSRLASLLSETVQNSFISSFFNGFSAICMLTAFLGVSLCLLSFLSDGFKLTQKGAEGVGLFLLTFLPPLLMVLYYPGAYIHALSYAGYVCVILLLLLPAMMSYVQCWREGKAFYGIGQLVRIVVMGCAVTLIWTAATAS